MQSPFNENNFPEGYPLNKAQEIGKHLDHWKPKELGIDIKKYYQAIIVAYQLGYNYDRILEEIINQIDNHNDQLFINLSQRSNNIIDDGVKDLKEDLPQYGHKPELSEHSWLKLHMLETSYGLTKISTFFNFVDQQIINQHQIKIILPQTKIFQKRWTMVQDSMIEADYPRIMTMGTMRGIDYANRK